MTSETEVLKRQVFSMRRRLKSLGEIAGVIDAPSGGGETARLTLKIGEVDDQVPYLMKDR